jgi:hypothetical protein
MSVTRQQASEAIEEFKTEYKGLSQVTFVLLENHRDFHDHYGKHAAQAAEAWAGKLGAYSRSTRTIALALAAHDDKSELAATLAHEGIGHSGEKRALIDAIIESQKHPGAMRDAYWRAVEDAYPDLRKSEQAEEIFSLMAETVHAMGGSKYNAKAFEHAWQKSVVDQSEPLQAWGLAQVVHHVAHGLRENTRQHQIFPASDTDQYRVLSHEEKLAAINSQLDRGDFNARERSIILERVRANAQNTERQPAEKTPEVER